MAIHGSYSTGGPPNKFKPGKPDCGELCPPEAKTISWDGVHFIDFGGWLSGEARINWRGCACLVGA